MISRFSLILRIPLLFLVGIIPLAFSGGSVFASAGSFPSDNFNTCSIKPQWGTFINPLHDTSTYSVNGSTVSISVPQGVNDHDIWATNRVVSINAPRFMMNAADDNFTIEVKMNSGVSSIYQTQGILIEQDPDTVLRFEFYGDGTNTIMFAARLKTGENPTTYYRQQIGVGNISPLYMRVQRSSGNQWTQSYSTSGTNWTAGPTNPIVYSMTVTQVGFYGGNTVVHPGDTAPAHTAIFDYFSNLDSPAGPDTPINCATQTQKIYLPVVNR
ncbi:MAG TPA: hypothetical protein VMT46_20085 [Anaerolineaceae bacterium]|nr:hypothetical protein [Anaerolineaceae bacterium]